MHYYTIIGWVYEAGYHCPQCARSRFGDDLHKLDTTDAEGNPLTPLHAGQATGDEYCDDCFEMLI